MMVSSDPLNRREPSVDSYDEEEAQRRFEATLKGALKTPPQPHKSKEQLTDLAVTGEKKGDAQVQTVRRPNLKKG